MPMPLTVSCFSKIQIGLTFLAPAHLGSPGKGPLNGCVWVCVCVLVISETGSPITGTCVGLGSELYLDGGVAGKPVPGFDGQSFLLCLWRGAKYCDQRLCVCLSARVSQKPPVQILQNSSFYTWPQLSSPLTTVNCVTNFRFSGWRHVFTWQDISSPVWWALQTGLVHTA